MTTYLHPGLLLTLYTLSAVSYRKAFPSSSESQDLEGAMEDICILLSIKICPTNY